MKHKQSTLTTHHQPHMQTTPPRLYTFTKRPYANNIPRSIKIKLNDCNEDDQNDKCIARESKIP